MLDSLYEVTPRTSVLHLRDQLQGIRAGRFETDKMQRVKPAHTMFWALGRVLFALHYNINASPPLGPRGIQPAFINSECFPSSFYSLS